MQVWGGQSPGVDYSEFSGLQHVLIGLGFPVMTGINRRKATDSDLVCGAHTRCPICDDEG